MNGEVGKGKMSSAEQTWAKERKEKKSKNKNKPWFWETHGGLL